MSIDIFTHDVYLWVSHYLAAACLITIVIWASTSYLFIEKWLTTVRDASSFFACIGIPTLVLAFRPANMDASYWEPIIWFFFSMLLLLELLWIAYLSEAVIKAIFSLPRAHNVHPTGGNPRRITRGY